jgi:hypothetical protein
LLPSCPNCKITKRAQIRILTFALLPLLTRPARSDNGPKGIEGKITGDKNKTTERYQQYEQSEWPIPNRVKYSKEFEIATNKYLQEERT